MRCSENNELIMKYIDGAATVDEIEKLKNHNEACENCKMEFNLLLDAVNAIQDLPELEVPLGFEAKVMNKIKEQKKAYNNPRIYAYWIVAFFGILIFGYNYAGSFLEGLINSNIIIATLQHSIGYTLAFLFDYTKGLMIDSFFLLDKIANIALIFINDFSYYIVLTVVLLAAANLVLINSLKLQKD